MKHKIIDQVLERSTSAKEDSDFTYFFSLLLAGESLAKTITLGMISAITNGKDKNRYRLEHSLVRTDGLGDWGRVLEDGLTGPASHYLLIDARSEQTELTEYHSKGVWQYEAVSLLKSALDQLEIEAEELPVKSDMKRWFRLFSALRNKTRAHGATTSTKASAAAEYLEKSIKCIYANFKLFNRPWAYLHQNLSGKYKVSKIAGDMTPFDFLKRESSHAYDNGVYVYFGAPRQVPLLKSDADLHDFYFANGGFNRTKFELLSYCTDDRIDGDAHVYSIPPGTLPASKTQGYGELFPVGNYCLSNAPDLIRDYVERPRLEDELHGLLIDDRHPIITLVGKGGIGKTSLSLRVLKRLYSDTRFEEIIWFSARDVDLQSSGPKPVRTSVLTRDDISQFYASLVRPRGELKEKGFNAGEYFKNQLGDNSNAALYVFDNFETTQNPVETFKWIDIYIRPPNKILITTRLRDFKGDWHVEVSGMEKSESRALIEQTADQLEISELLNEKYIDDLINKSGGHPYVMKILLGDVAKERRIRDITQIIAGSDEILTALFERTYSSSSLSPCAKRAFMTLAAWNSAVPRLALEAVLMRSISKRDEIEKGIESLVQFSMAESHIAQKDNQEYISLPLVASIFGKKKLSVSPYKTKIKADVELLQMFGPGRSSDVRLGLAKRLERFIGNVSQRIDNGDSFDNYVPILNMICRNYNLGWLIRARWHLENGSKEDIELAKNELNRFLEEEPAGENAAEAWGMLRDAYFQTGDKLGEINARIERAQISTVSFYDISNTANRLNRLLHEGALEVDKEEKHQLAKPLADVLDRRKNEADADDFSRMAWLNWHLGLEQIAQEYAERGLKIDPENLHCKKILERLKDY